MPKENEALQAINDVITNALYQMHLLIISSRMHDEPVVQIMKVLLHNVIITAANFTEITTPGASISLWTEVEEEAKQSLLTAVKNKLGINKPEFSVAHIKEDDYESGMNYIGRELIAAIYQHLVELPPPLRKATLLLESVEVLLANVLIHQFSDNEPHKILDSFCEHTHNALNKLQSRQVH